LETSLKELRKVRETAFDHRAANLLTILESRTTGFAPADASSENDNKVKINCIQQHLNIEGMRKPFRAIHSAISTHHVPGVSRNCLFRSGLQTPKLLHDIVLMTDRSPNMI
jgi:hypothetical protein